MFQVYAYHSNGARDAIGAPHASQAGAAWHVLIATRALSPEDARTTLYTYTRS
jgi:hypothetical protein